MLKNVLTQRFEPYQILTRKFPNLDIRPDFMFIFPVIVGDTIAKNQEVEILLRKLFAKQIISFLLLRENTKLLVNTIDNYIQVKDIISDKLKNLLTTNTSIQNNIERELSEYLRTQHITSKVDTALTIDESFKKQIIQVTKQLQKMIDSDPYLKEYAPELTLITDYKSGVIYPIIIGTKKFQASDRAIALIIALSKLFNLYPLQNTQNLEKIKKLIKKGIVNKLIELFSTKEKITKSDIENLVKEYKQKIEVNTDNNILQKIGDILKQSLKYRKYTDNEILSALKNIELALNENIYINSLGNTLSDEINYDFLEKLKSLILNEIIEHMNIYSENLRHIIGNVYNYMINENQKFSLFLRTEFLEKYLQKLDNKIVEYHINDINNLTEIIYTNALNNLSILLTKIKINNNNLLSVFTEVTNRIMNMLINKQIDMYQIKEKMVNYVMSKSSGIGTIYNIVFNQKSNYFNTIRQLSGINIRTYITGRNSLIEKHFRAVDKYIFHDLNDILEGVLSRHITKNFSNMVSLNTATTIYNELLTNNAYNILKEIYGNNTIDNQTIEKLTAYLTTINDLIVQYLLRDNNIHIPIDKLIHDLEILTSNITTAITSQLQVTLATSGKQSDNDINIDEIFEHINMAVKYMFSYLLTYTLILLIDILTWITFYLTIKPYYLYAYVKNSGNFSNIRNMVSENRLTDEFKLYVKFSDYGINLSFILHEIAIIWAYNILAIFELDDLYSAPDLEDFNLSELPAPGEWANISEENIKYIVKYFGKIIKVPIITYNDSNSRVTYMLPFMKNPIKTTINDVKKFVLTKF